MEATGAPGRYEYPLIATLQAAGLPVIVVNPRRSRAFAKAQGLRAKTDRIDATMLAPMGALLQLQPRALPDEQTRQLQDFQARRRQLIQRHTAQTNRLQQARQTRVRSSITTVLLLLKKQLQDLDTPVKDLIAAQPQWQEKADLIDGVKGVGTQTARLLVAQLPELGQLSRPQIAMLAGLAPMNHDSGRLKGRRAIRGGRVQVRTGLYMAPLAAIRGNGVIQAFYRRLRSKGKPFKVALTAAMHKLLTILNAIVRTGKPWQQKLVPVT